MSLRRRFWLGSLLGFALIAQPTPGLEARIHGSLALPTEQPEIQAEPSNRSGVYHLRIGNRAGDPGATVSLPVRLEGTGSYRVNALELEILYPAASLRHISVDSASDAIRSQVPENIPSGNNLTVRLSPLEGGSLSGGLMAFLVFKIREEAQPGKAVVSVKALGAAEGGKGGPLKGGEGVVEILSPPQNPESEMQNLDPYIPACFFYMH